MKSNPDLHSIKYCFDIVKSKLVLFYPIINGMNKIGIENQNYEIFIKAIEDLNFYFRLPSNTSLSQVVSDANLFLTDTERLRFYKFCKHEYNILRENLDGICMSILTIPDKELIIIKKVYFDNINCGICCLPNTLPLDDNRNIPEELIRGIKAYYDDFSNIIEQLDVSENIIKTSNINNNELNTFQHIFAKDNIYDYIDVLTKTTPPILNKTDGKYKFTGSNQQRGVVASYFKYLKSINIIKADANRDMIAKTLSNEIDNFSISPSSIDNISKKYEVDFEPQIIKILATISFR